MKKIREIWPQIPFLAKKLMNKLKLMHIIEDI